MSAIIAGVFGVACGDDPAAPVDLVAPVEIVAVPDLDTLGLADSLLLTAISHAGTVRSVQWEIAPRNEATVSDTLVYRPQRAGTEVVRAVVALVDGARGTATRVMVTAPNLAPRVQIVPPPWEDFLRVPLGDTIVLAADFQEPDGDSIAAGAITWSIDGQATATGDTLRVAVDSVRGFLIEVAVRDPAGAVGRAQYSSTSYDPIVPATWRTWVRRAGTVTRSGSGTLAVNYGLKTDGGNALCDCPLFGLDHDGSVVWETDTGSGATPIAATTAAFYFTGPDGGLLRLTDGGVLDWTIPHVAVGPALLPGGDVVAMVNRGISAPRSLVLVDHAGQVQFETTLDSITTRALALSVGAQSTTYTLGSSLGIGPGWRAHVYAVDPTGTILWHRPFDAPGAGQAVALIPAADTTIVVSADSLYALDASSGAIRWRRAERPFRIVAGHGWIAFPVADEVVRVRLGDGMTLERTPVPGVQTTVSPVLAGDGRILVAVDRAVVLIDPATGVESWRHRTAGRPGDMLIPEHGGQLIVIDNLGHVEQVAVPVTPLDGPWPQGWGGSMRNSRIRSP